MTMLSGNFNKLQVFSGWVGLFYLFFIKNKSFFLYCSLGAIVKIKGDMETIKY